MASRFGFAAKVESRPLTNIVRDHVEDEKSERRRKIVEPLEQENRLGRMFGMIETPRTNGSI